MKFKYINKNTFNVGSPIYILNEESFYFEPYVESDFTLMLGCSYLGINISTVNNKLINISGLCPQKIWIHEKLNKPLNIDRGEVVFVSDESLISGTGTYLLNDATILYDSESNWFFIRPNYDIQSSQNIEFADNCILCLSDGIFAGLWINPIFI